MRARWRRSGNSRSSKRVRGSRLTRFDDSSALKKYGCIRDKILKQESITLHPPRQERGDKDMIMQDRAEYIHASMHRQEAKDKLLAYARRAALASPILRPHLLILSRTIRAGETVTVEMIRPFFPTSCELGERGQVIGSADAPPAKKFW